MNRIAATVALLALLSVVPAGAVAQADNSTQSGPGVDVPQKTGTQIEDGLTLLSSSYNSDTEMLTLVFRAEQPTSVTLSDLGDAMREGEIDQRTEIVDGKTKIRFEVTERNGYVGVSIGTRDTLYAYPVKVGSTDFVPGGPSPEDTWLAGSTVFVMFAIALPGAFWANRKMRGKEHDQH